MTHPAQQPRTDAGWRWRDLVAAACLFLATATVVLWQNAHLVVLWDLSYVLDSAARIATGQMPYRDFPFAHAPLTFLIQAAIIRLAGRVFFHHVLYCALVGGAGTVLTWRIVLHSLRGRMRAAWAVSLLLAVPLTVLGIYCILPHPSYDCDCAFSILCAVWLLQRPGSNEWCDVGGSRYPTLAPKTRCKDGVPAAPSGLATLLRQFAAGACVVVPLFFKQNMGLVFLASVLSALLVLLVARLIFRASVSPASPAAPSLLAVLGGAVTLLTVAGLLLHLTVGLRNYIYWTIGFAVQRRLPGLQQMIGVYREPALVWMLPCMAVGLALWRSRLVKAKWARMQALGLLAAPLIWTLLTLVVYDDADERGDSLLVLWPLLLILSAALTVFNLRRGLSMRALLPGVVLVTINGTLMSQQLWGSTYAIWPLLVLLIAEMIVFLDLDKTSFGEIRRLAFAPVMAVVVAVTLLACGGFYTASEERLSYAQFPEGAVAHATFPELAGMATPGPYLPEFEELLHFAAANIPANDGLILIPGEDPFYFVTGRMPQFPVLLFDPATDPYSPNEVVEQARAHRIRWLIVKRELQIKKDPTPQGEAVMKALMGEFAPVARLRGYDVYRRP